MKKKIVLCGFILFAAMALSGCGSASDGSDLVGKWEFSNITQPAAPKIFFVGYEFKEDGTLKVYNSADPIQVQTYTWSLNPSNKNIIDLNGADGKSQKNYRVYPDGLRIVEAKAPLNEMNPVYKKMDEFSFSDLIEPDARQCDLTAEQIVTELKNKGLPIGEIRAVTAENEDSRLIGTPNQYTSKAVFADTDFSQSTDPGAALIGGSVEVYVNSEDATSKWLEYVSMEGNIINGTSIEEKSVSVTNSNAQRSCRIGNVILTLDNVEFSASGAPTKLNYYVDALLEINK